MKRLRNKTNKNKLYNNCSNHHQQPIETRVNHLPLLLCSTITTKIIDITIHLNQRLNRPILVKLLHRHDYRLLLHLPLKVLRTSILHIDLHHLCKLQRMENVDHLKISTSRKRNKAGVHRILFFLLLITAIL
jgi:hypothetical protein